MEWSVSYTDLFIIGVGLAGLIAALWASKYRVPARIIDDKAGRVTKGHADGITCRTMEVLESFDLSQNVLREAALDFQIRHWVRFLLMLRTSSPSISRGSKQAG